MMMEYANIFFFFCGAETTFKQ